MKPQSEKAHAFAALHERADAFVMAAPWDLGSARMAAGQGFEALELTPRTLSISYGMRGGALDVTADMLLDAARAISAGTDLPLTVDLGDTVPDAPEDVASLVTAIIDAGAVGVTLSDTTKSDALWPILSDTAARQRIAAARDAADAFDIPVTLTARTEIVSSGEGEADEAATRLRRLQSVGADVLDIPGLHAIEELEMVRKETLRPLSLPLRKGGPQPMDKMKVSALAKAGVKRISADDSMVLLAYGAVLNAGQSVLDRGAIGATLPAEMKYATVLAAMQAGRERVKEQ
ncbi:MAG: isocitrate lyase/phosphoenolpyruvate mutase family protein [Pseudomonadota bacterium]